MKQQKTQTIPTIESSIFTANTAAQFALCEVSPRELFRIKEFLGAAKLRANTYVASGFVTEAELDEFGTELDVNDERSAHFLVFERVAADNSLARVIGNLRLVQKTVARPEPLPVEEFFADYFSTPLPIGSVEVSRLIARHENPGIQSMLKWPLFIAGHQRVMIDQNGSAYGLLDPMLTRHLTTQRVPVTALQSARYIEQINATKQPVKIDVPQLGNIINVVGSFGVDVHKPVSYLDLPTQAVSRQIA